MNTPRPERPSPVPMIAQGLLGVTGLIGLFVALQQIERNAEMAGGLWLIAAAISFGFLALILSRKD